MKLRKKLLKSSRLYAIIDKGSYRKKSFLKLIKAISNSSVDIIQLRDKFSQKAEILSKAILLKKLLTNSKKLFIINDYLDVAKIAACDGVHLGQDDISAETARKILGKDRIIGVSCNSLKQAQVAQRKGADYIAVGPIFPTPTKPKAKPIGLDIIKQLRKKIKIPFFVIGGINLSNINLALSCGAKRIAVIRAVLRSKNPALAAENLSKLLH
jgi:thiamine-phosphate pyrophosphorylase